jgi:hypothetical protein
MHEGSKEVGMTNMRMLPYSIVFLLACGESEVEPKKETKAAMLSTSDETFRVVYGDGDRRDQFPAILDGARPRDFHWALLTVPAPLVEAGSVILDLRQPNGVTFTQVYYDVCNPAQEDFRSCWLFEDYQSGATGISGRITVTSDTSSISGLIDVAWEGVTDRFGTPAQWHRHGTLSDFTVPVGAQ